MARPIRTELGKAEVGPRSLKSGSDCGLEHWKLPWSPSLEIIELYTGTWLPAFFLGVSARFSHDYTFLRVTFHSFGAT